MDEQSETYVCERCGSVVGSRDAHEAFHTRLTRRGGGQRAGQGAGPKRQVPPGRRKREQQQQQQQ